MVVLLVAFMPDFLKINAGAQMIAIYGVGTHKYDMSINVIAESITLERCEELDFLHIPLLHIQLLILSIHIGIRLSAKLFRCWKSNILELMVSEPGRTRDIYLFSRLSKLAIERKGHQCC